MDYKFCAQKIYLAPKTANLFGNDYVELRAREREELPAKEAIEIEVRRNPVVQQVMKVFSARIVEIRPM